MLKLSRKWAEVLHAQPETGMGYVIATVVLKNGREYPRALIVEGIIASIDGNDKIPFGEDEIADLNVTHDKGALRR